MRHYTTRKYTRAARGQLWNRHPTEITYRCERSPVYAARLRGALLFLWGWNYDSAGRTWATSPDGLTRICAEPVPVRAYSPA